MPNTFCFIFSFLMPLSLACCQWEYCWVGQEVEYIISALGELLAISLEIGFEMKKIYFQQSI